MVAPSKSARAIEESVLDKELRRWVDATAGLLTRHGIDGTFYYLSDACRTILGYDAEEIVGTKLAAILHPDDAVLLATSFGQIPTDRNPGTVTLRARHRDGTYVWLEVTAGVLADIPGEPSPQIIGVLRPVNNRAEIENQLRRGHGIASTFFDATPMIIAQSSSDGRVRYVNAYFEKLTGWPRDRPEDLLALAHPDPENRAQVSAISATQNPGPIDVSLTAADGRQIDISWVATYLADGSSIAAGMDVTRRTAMESALRESEAHARDLNVKLQEENRRKDEFLAVLAHELRNPLAPIANAVDALMVGNLGEASVARAREVIAQKARHLIRLVDDLLDLSRINRGVIPLKMCTCNLADVLSEAVSTSRPLLDAAGHSFTQTIEQDSICLHADATRLVQVFSNLLNNAAKYTPPGGEVSLVASRQGGRVTVRVRDTGRGIPRPDLPRVFDLFYQSQRSAGAMGIGLSLVRSIVELHGGSVEARSEGAGLGSEFIVHLPALTERSVPAHFGRETVSRKRLERRRILVIDDDEAVADGFALLLESMGHDVRAVHDGPTALAMVAEFDPWIVFIDLNMPGMDGYETAEKLRSTAGGIPLKMIALTGYGLPSVEARIRKAGFESYLAKPAMIEDVERLLA